MARSRVGSGALLALLLWPSCGGPGEPAKTVDSERAPSDGSASGARPAEPGATPTEPGASARTPATIKTTGTPPPTAPGDLEITYQVCSAVHAVYERLLRAEEMAKLEQKKLPPKAHQAALADVEKVIADGAGQWLGQCQGIVGSVQVGFRWRCAQEATDVARFDGCMDGKFDDEAKGP